MFAAPAALSSSFLPVGISEGSSVLDQDTESYQALTTHRVSDRQEPDRPTRGCEHRFCVCVRRLASLGKHERNLGLTALPTPGALLLLIRRSNVRVAQGPPEMAGRGLAEMSGPLSFRGADRTGTEPR